MPVPDFGGLPPYADFNDVTSKLNELVQQLKQLLLNLDTLNIRSLHAKVIEAGTITADKMNVNELSAISANLGHITAGLIESIEIYGSYIATRRNAYPRAEMSSQSDLFGAYRDPNNSVVIQADYQGAPSFVFTTNGIFKARISTLPGTLLIDAQDHMEINVLNGGDLVLPSFGHILGSNGSNLGLELDRKARAGISTGGSGSHNHGIPDGTVLMVQGGGTVTYRVAGNHTHEQTS